LPPPNKQLRFRNPERSGSAVSAGASVTGAAVAALENVNARIGRYRWTICALLFFAATINYIDRQVIGILKPTLRLNSAGMRSLTAISFFWFKRPMPWASY